MNTTKVPGRTSLTARVAGLVATASMMGVPAQAQVVENARGNLTCFHAARAVPGLSGLPLWPDAGNKAPNQTAANTALRERSDINDPRWSNAPLMPMRFSNEEVGSASDNAKFRLLVAGGEAALSVQMAADSDGAGANDKVYFGLADADGRRAVGVLVSFEAASGRHIPVESIQTFKMETQLVNGQSRRVWSVDDEPAGWVSQDRIAFWNNEDDNAARWALNMRFNLSQLNLTKDDKQEGRYFVAVHVSQGLDGTNEMTTDYATTNIFRGCGANSCVTYPPAPIGSDGRPVIAASFPENPADWASLSSLSGNCGGVRIIPERLGGKSLVANGSGIYVPDTSAKPDHLWVLPGYRNQFVAQPLYATGQEVSRGRMQVNLRIANWGTTASANAGWNPLPESPQRSEDPNQQQFIFPCQNTASGNNICGTVTSENIQLGRNHQCILAELSPVGGGTAIQFDQASAYKNMWYRTMSEVHEVAEVNVKGLAAALGSNNAREVYLHVVRRNMPAPGIPTSMDVPALEALRAQVDPFFSSPHGRCQNSAERCVNFVGEEHGTCLSPPAAPTDEFWCVGGQTVNLGPLGVWCRYPSAASCVAPAGGGFDPSLSARSEGQTLREHFPNYEVYPYYDTGRRYAQNGRTHKVLAPMPSFGIYLTHEGDFFGYIHSLTEEVTPASGASPAVTRNLVQVRPDLYKITVPNEGVKKLHVRLATVDEQPDPLFQIVGTATPLPLGLGNATFTGVALTRELDLTKTTIRVKRLLEENGRDLVSGLGSGVTLTRAAGALPGLAVFTRVGSPTITMQVANLPLLGQTVAVQVVGASIATPRSCFMGIAGTASLKTEFVIEEVGKPAISVYGSDVWGCLPGQLLNL